MRTAEYGYAIYDDNGEWVGHVNTWEQGYDDVHVERYHSTPTTDKIKNNKKVKI